jgi:hypothetical protein
MTTIQNPESLTHTLCRTKSGPMAVVVYSNAYAESLDFLAGIKMVIRDFPSVQLIVMNADENKHLLSLPVLGFSEVPSLILFDHGRPISQPLSDLHIAVARLRRLGAASIETDDFEPVGTFFKVARGVDTRRWVNTSSQHPTRQLSTIRGLLSPLWDVMDSIYEI